jgi:hypothetical protein
VRCPECRWYLRFTPSVGQWEARWEAVCPNPVCEVERVLPDGRTAPGLMTTVKEIREG